MSEIKLGWYRSINGNLFHALGFRTDSTEYKVVGYWDGQHIQEMRKEALLENFDYIGTELGEWVSPDDVRLSELPIRARFRNANHEQWSSDGLLVGSRCNNGILTFSDDFKLWNQCQVWRAKKCKQEA